MRTSHSNRICVDPGFFVQLAIALMLLPFNWVLGWLFAAALHELCHYLALHWCGVYIYTMRISLTGAVMETEPMRLKHELISTVAGPFGGICMVALLRVFPEAAISALMQSAFNLLPVYPFDGGRAIIALFTHLWSREKAERILFFIQICFFTLMLLLSVLAWCFWNLGLLPIGVSLLLLVRSMLIKTPCKHTKQIVQ